jgi:hypothetical protein
VKQNRILFSASAVSERDCPLPLKKMTGPSNSYANVVKWSKDIKQFLSDTALAENSILFCFTETNIVNEH